MKPTLAFRVDVSERLGIGHFMRCLALARRFKKFPIIFVSHKCRLVENLVKNITGFNSFRIEYLPSGIQVAKEISILEQYVQKYAVQILIADLLIYPHQYVNQLRQIVPKLVTFYEQIPKDWISDLVINYNSIAKEHTLIKKESSHHSTYCLGPEYIVLRDSFKREMKRIKDRIENVVISMGGTDPNGITLKVLKSLKRFAQKVRLIIHIGPGFLHRKKLDSAIDNLGMEIDIQDNVKELADILTLADIAIASGGNIMYELCYLGVPTLTIAQNDHQDEFCRELNKQGAVRHLGIFSVVTEELIEKSVKGLSTNKRARMQMQKRAMSIVDGCGLNRIEEKINRLLH